MKPEEKSNKKTKGFLNSVTSRCRERHAVSGWTEQSKILSAMRSRVCGQLAVVDVTADSAGSSLAREEGVLGNEVLSVWGSPEYLGLQEHHGAARRALDSGAQWADGP